MATTRPDRGFFDQHQVLSRAFWYKYHRGPTKVHKDGLVFFVRQRRPAQRVLPNMRRRSAAVVLISVSAIAACAALIVASASVKLDTSVLVVALASVLTLASVPNTLLLVHAHVQSWRCHRLQLRVVRIVLMVPIYALDSWLGLVNRGSVRPSPARSLIDKCLESRNPE